MKYELRGDAAWLTIDRPEKANALAPETLEEGTALLERAAEERVAVLTGAGETFCAGADLDAVAGFEGTEEARAFSESLTELLIKIETLDVPVVAAVNGDAYGAGFELVVASDLAVAAEGASLCMPATKLGLKPPLMPERVADIGGRKRASELALTGDPIGAEKAEEWGVINRAVPRQELEDTVAGFVSSVAEADREATRITKDRIASGRAGYDEIREATAERFASEEASERFRDAAER